MRTPYIEFGRDWSIGLDSTIGDEHTDTHRDIQTHRHTHTHAETQTDRETHITSLKNQHRVTNKMQQHGSVAILRQ